jgi:hypothetical protein
MAFEGPVQSVATPEQELALLREQIAQKEQELASLRESRPREEIAHERIIHHRDTGHETLAPGYAITKDEAQALALNLDPESDDETIEELRSIMETKGIKNAFAVLENLNSPHLEDDFHRFLVQYLVKGMPVQGFTEKQPAWKALHMTMYEIALPEMAGTDQEKAKPLKELLSAMEQFYSGMFSLEHAHAGEPAYFTLELAVPVGQAHLMFYAAVPNSRCDLFEKQILAIFPDAHISVQPNDYNVFVQDGTSMASVAMLAHPAVLPLKDYTDFDYDPINSLLNAFGKISPENEGASLQILIKPESDRHTKHFRRILDNLHKGEDKHSSLRLPESFIGEAFRDLGTTFFKNNEKIEAERTERRNLGSNKIEIEQVEKKISTPILSVNMRFAVSSQNPARATHILSELESSFHQFENPLGNRIIWQRITKGTLKRLFHDISFRLFEDTSTLPLSLHELTTLYHFPPKGIESSPHLKQSRSTGAAAPMELPSQGISLGTNTFRGQTTQVRLSPEDRLRHMYVIGQTGTGKTGYLKTLIEQDIRDGNGVCFIDPHGNDILDVLASIPPERYEDVIYFDPAELTRPFGLNLLEFDASHPEQKTFIVNELLAIFRRLYGDVPESMGPAFEQYFRNATLLVMEDPESGSTLMDIGRVLSNKPFRDLKLSKSMNPIVNQFWNEIATKAGGDASLENIVPYITNKFDDFTANDFMRPIIGQQESSFNFRQIIDNKKILLVNLSKGRLGERNANLLGLILVGKLFMAALSRADNPRGDFAPFYLYIDEFQNITTDSIPGILSEARKYKLSLTVAHQFLAQIDDKIRDAVFGNVGSMSVFRVGQEDGEFFEKQFAPTFSASDFTNIENRSAYVKILANGVPQKPFNIKTLDLAPGNPGQVDDLRQLSYLTYGRDRATVETLIKQRYLS